MYRISVYILLAKQEDSSGDDKRCPFWCLPSLGKRSLLSCQQRTETSSPHPPQGLTRSTDGTSFPLSKTQEKHFMLPIPWAKGTRAGTQTFLQTQKPLFETRRGNARFGVAKYLISGFILLLHINFSGVCLARHVILDWSYVHRLWRVCESLFCCSYWAKSRLLPGTHAEKSVIWEQMVWLSEWEKERERRCLGDCRVFHSEEMKEEWTNPPQHDKTMKIQKNVSPDGHSFRIHQLSMYHMCISTHQKEPTILLHRAGGSSDSQKLRDCRLTI